MLCIITRTGVLNHHRSASIVNSCRACVMLVMLVMLVILSKLAYTACRLVMARAVMLQY
eukprot:XP_001699903.1 predicted protein [Chlamydomonas reinhardtii]